MLKDEGEERDVKRRARRERMAAVFLRERLAAEREAARRGVAESTGFTVRSMAIGLVLCLFISTGTIYSNSIMNSTFMAWSFSTPVALFLLFYLVLGNSLAQLINRKWSLGRGEMVLIHVMMIISASLPTFGLVQHLLPMITGVFYFATPENNWAELIRPHVPGWIVPDSRDAILGFYEGIGPKEAIPWGVWIKPLSYWSLFLLSLYLVSICLMVMVRKQWVEEERLLYPIVQAPLEMIGRRGDEASGRLRLAPAFRKSQLWIGFAVPFLVGTLHGLNAYFPYLPTLDLSTSLTFFRDTVKIPFTISFSLIGFSYFISRELAAGIWVFFLLGQIELGILNLTGFQSGATEKLSFFSNPSAPYLTHQSLGALLMFIILVLWRGRGHLRDIGRKVFGSAKGVQDFDEVMSYRGAVLGLLGGLAIMGIWLHATGLPAWVVPLFLLVALLIFIALSRIVAEAGVALARAPLIAPDFIISSLGVSRLGAGGVTSLAYTYPWTADIVTFPMASVANGLKMADEVIRGPKRGLFWAMMLALVSTLIAAYGMMLYLSYRYGGINLNGWFWQHSSVLPLQYIAQVFQDPSTTGLGGWLFTGLGAALMWFLTGLQQRSTWWSIHPLGLALSGTMFTSGVMWFNVLIAWAIKGLVLRYGGSRLYSQTRYFFIGMILGAFVVAGTWLFIDYAMGTQGNYVLTW